MLDENLYHLVGYWSLANKTIFFDVKRNDGDGVIVPVLEILLNSFGGIRRPLKIRTTKLFKTYAEATEYLRKYHGVR